jgi:protein-tyrosine phosphatase
MYQSLLTVCLGNICRSPTAEFMFREKLPDHTISSAGLMACRHSDGTGWDMDATARAIAQKNGLSCPPHEARLLTREIIQENALILVMDLKQRNQIAAQYPDATSKTFLLGHWLTTPSKDIVDPYRHSDEVYQQVYEKIEDAVQLWVEKLKR